MLKRGIPWKTPHPPQLWLSTWPCLALYLGIGSFCVATVTLLLSCRCASEVDLIWRAVIHFSLTYFHSTLGFVCSVLLFCWKLVVSIINIMWLQFYRERLLHKKERSSWHFKFLLYIIFEWLYFYVLYFGAVWSFLNGHPDWFCWHVSVVCCCFCGSELLRPMAVRSQKQKSYS